MKNNGHSRHLHTVFRRVIGINVFNIHVKKCVTFTGPIEEG